MSIKGDDGTTSGQMPPFNSRFAIWGDSQSGIGILGTSDGPRPGVVGINRAIGLEGIGVEGQGSNCGVLGSGETGVLGRAEGGNGGGLNGSNGVHGIALGGAVGVRGRNDSQSGVGVFAESFEGIALQALAASPLGRGIVSTSGGTGFDAINNVTNNRAILASISGAATFIGLVFVNGRLLQFGGGFLIDHPTDPANKYLSHSFVESPDRKNVYDGIVALDDAGEAEVELPEWFDALNGDCRYQLTCLGGHAPVFISQEIEKNRFRISGGTSGLKVSWQVTGIRQDGWAKSNPMTPEAAKPEAERGTYLEPSLFGEPEEKSVCRVRFPDPPEAPPSHDGSEGERR